MNKLVFFLAAMSVGATAAAQIPVHPALHDKFYFAIGAFSPKTTTEAQLNSSSLGIGTNITFEDTLDIESRKAVPSFVGRMRLGERWRIEAEYFELNRNGQRVIERDIQWGDVVFPANAQVSSSFDFSDLRLSAGYSFFRRPDKELGVGFGFHMASYDVSLATGSTGNQQEDVLAPLPVISAYGQFALTEEWAVGGRLDRFSLAYDKFDGRLTSLALDVTWQPFRHVGFGLSYRSLFISMEADDGDKTLKFKQTFEGPMLFMSASF
jgi:hypothetical protein